MYLVCLGSRVPRRFAIRRTARCFTVPYDRERYIARAVRIDRYSACVWLRGEKTRSGGGEATARKSGEYRRVSQSIAEYRGVSRSITRIELSRSWQRTDREYATLYVVLRIASERDGNREREAAREGQTAAREGADHVVKLTVYKPRRRSRGHVLIKNLAHCEERIFEFVAWRFLRGTLLRKLFAPGYGWPCRVAFRTRSRTHLADLDAISTGPTGQTIDVLSAPESPPFFLLFIDVP